MSDVKLFRVTEFAQSTFASPLAHRNSIHPVWVMLIIAIWVATAGQWPTWQVLVQNSPNVSLGVLVNFGFQWAAASLLLMALACWRHTFKPAITVLLIWTALGACQMVVLVESDVSINVTPGAFLSDMMKPDIWRLLLNWKCVATLLQVAGVPAVLLWMANIRRIRFTHNLATNALLGAASYAVLVWTRSQIGSVIPWMIDPLAIF